MIKTRDYTLLFLEQVPACWYIGNFFFLGGVENVFQPEQKDQRRILRREALNIVGDGTQDMSTCAWEYKLQFSSGLFV